MISQETLNRWYDEGQSSKAKVGVLLDKLEHKIDNYFNEERLEEVYRELQGLLAKYD